MTRADRDDDTLPMRYGKYTVVWQRGADGAWRMAVDMWGSRPAPEGAAE